MGLHPRIGGRGGRLARPAAVLVVAVADQAVDRGDVLASRFGQQYDPFQRLDDRGMDRRRKRPDPPVQVSVGGLLLVEEFARIDVTRPRQLRSWLLARGALNRMEFYADEPPSYEPPVACTVEGWEVQDTATGIQNEQQVVRAELDWLVELSLCRPATGEIWNPNNGPSWEDALAATGARLRYRAERAIRSTIRLVPVTDDGEEKIVRMKGTVRPISWREQREWRSVLAPIALQLSESWQRISEGLPGATYCRECGQPFLILDGRRTTFCTDRERNRHNQRTRRGAPGTHERRVT